MTLPNFLIIGAAKSGTTSLMKYVGQHPHVFMCPVKTHFFYLGDDPSLIRDTPDGWFRRPVIETTRSGYEARFESAGDASAIGETCDTYLPSERAAKRIHQYIPDAKLIAILREPAGRAFSSYTHMLRDGEETLSFADGLAQEPKRIAEDRAPIWQYRQRGYYYQQLKIYMDLFGRERVRVYVYDDLCADVDGLLRDIFEFLGVDPGQKIDTSLRYNVSGTPRTGALRTLHHGITQPNRFKSLLRSILPKRMARTIARHVIQGFQMRALEKPEFPDDVRRALIEDFREDILKLQDLLQRDLSKWLE
ncbi:MAG: sulfotransferase [Phycisphaerales bacterium]